MSGPSSTTWLLGRLPPLTERMLMSHGMAELMSHGSGDVGPTACQRRLW